MAVKNTSKKGISFNTARYTRHSSKRVNHLKIGNLATCLQSAHCWAAGSSGRLKWAVHNVEICIL